MNEPDSTQPPEGFGAFAQYISRWSAERDAKDSEHERQLVYLFGRVAQLEESNAHHRAQLGRLDAYEAGAEMRSTRVSEISTHLQLLGQLMNQIEDKFGDVSARYQQSINELHEDEDKREEKLFDSQLTLRNDLIKDLAALREEMLKLIASIKQNETAIVTATIDSRTKIIAALFDLLKVVAGGLIGALIAKGSP